MWIESHQTLREHPKARKLAILLGVSVPAAIGHLHCLWWWAMDYAQEGDLSRFDAEDIAVAAMWDGDPELLVSALTKARFIETADETSVGSIHDWHDYAGRLIDKRRQNADRQSAYRERTRDVKPKSPAESNQNRSGREADRKADAETSQAKADAQKRAHRIPGDFAVKDEWRAWARQKGMTDRLVDVETERFVNYWQGNGKRMIDWYATWRNWMLRAHEQGGSPSSLAVRPVAASRQNPSGRQALSREQLAAIAKGEG